MMTRKLTLTFAIMTSLTALPAQAQITRLVPLTQSAPTDQTITAPSTRIAAARPITNIGPRTSSELRVDPYKAMQAAYQPTTPADIPPTLLDTAPVPPSSTTPAPNYAVPDCSGNLSGGTVTSPPVYQQPAYVQSQTPAVIQYSYPPPAYVQRYTPLVPIHAVPAAPVNATVPVAQVGLRPLVPVAPAPRSYYVSNGLLGQPVIYVPGQPVRNFFRYLTP